MGRKLQKTRTVEFLFLKLYKILCFGLKILEITFYSINVLNIVNFVKILLTNDKRATVNVQKLNVQNWENAEIQTNGGSDFGMFRFPRFWPLSFLQICSKTDLDWI